ncbi:hypothetical protein NMG60_11034039 [Bertholletia excelsa]
MVNDGPKRNDAADTSQGGTTVCNQIEVMNNDNATLVTNDGKCPIQEEKNEETTLQEEHIMEEAEKNEANGLEEEDNKQHETGEEDKAGEGERKKEQKRKREGKKGKEIEQKKNTEKVGSNSKEKGKRSRKRDRKKEAQRGSKGTKLEDETGSSRKKKKSKRAESMGMIFMCNAKTKKDCYRYRVLGLPANKRDTVEKVYKGMRLFLFDVDLRLMYGIYKAAGPGGYNIEPQAFKSAFPSQVRFTILEDCLPLAEEKFKAVIKENYFTRNKFDCQLNSQQVKKLCKLFHAASKGSMSRRAPRDLRAEIYTVVDRNRVRRRSPDEERRVRRRSLDEERRSSPLSDRGYRDHPIVYEREAYPLTVASLPPRYQPLPPASVPSYASYGRTLEVDVYGRDPPVEHHDRHLLYLDLRQQDEIISGDPYISYREPPPYREPVYSVGPPPDYDSPGLRPEYRSHSDRPQHGRYSAVAPSEYGRPRY